MTNAKTTLTLRPMNTTRGEWSVGYCDETGRHGHCVDLFGCMDEAAARAEIARKAEVYGWNVDAIMVRPALGR